MSSSSIRDRSARWCRGWWSAAQGGHVDRVSDQFGAHVISDRPTDDSSGPGVDDDSEVDPAFAGAVLGDVLDPQSVRAVGSELAVHQIIGPQIGWLGPRATLASPEASHALQPPFAHQPLNPLVIHLVAEPEAKLGGHPPIAVRAKALLMNHAHQIPELGVGEHPCCLVGLGVTPRVERRSGHLHRDHAWFDRQIGTPVDDEGVDHFGRTFSRAK
jgi:hypothetical protein